jgi:glycosyltransferase involved in cell wall biosynthesis
MKTILIAHNYSKDSFSYMSYEVANYLSRNNFKVIFISHNPFFNKIKKVKYKNGELIITSWSSKNRPTGIKDVICFLKIYKKYKPDYIIGHFVGANISILISKIISFGKAKCFIYYHTLSNQIGRDRQSNLFKKQFNHFRKKIFYKLFVNLYLCPSELAKKDICETFNINPNNTRVILNAIEDRNKNRINTYNPKLITYLGRLDPSKNVTLLVESFIEFKMKNPTSDLRLNIAGSGPKSKEISSICYKYSFLNFKGAIPYEKVDDLISNSAYTIIPSLSDNLPTVGIESLMNGTPIIISNKTGLSKYCFNGKNSIVFNPIKSELIKIFEKISNEIPNEKIRSEARNLFEKKFNINTYSKEIEKLVLNN